MTNLQRRLERDRRRRERKEWLKGALKVTMRKVLAFFVVFAMLSAMAKVPAIHAFFTAKATSPEMVFEVKNQNRMGLNTSAEVLFTAEYLLAAEPDEQIEAEGEKSTLLLYEEEGSKMTLMGDETKSPQEETDCGKINAYISLDGDYDSGDAYIPSIKVHYENHSTKALSGKLEGDKLLVVFDRSVMSSWFNDREGLPSAATFQVTGQGYIDGLYLFDFSGTASLKLDGSYETISIAIEGREDFILPDSGDTTKGTYKLRDQNGKELTGATWSLEKATKGAEINISGNLTVSDTAAEGSIVILATLDSEGRTLVARKSVNLHIRPHLKIEGSDSIFIPRDEKEENVSYQVIEVYKIDSVEVSGSSEVLISQTSDIKTLYHAVVKDDRGRELGGESVRWSLEQRTPGVTLSDNGELTVAPDASSGNVTLVAASLTEPDVFGVITVSLNYADAETRIEAEETTLIEDATEPDIPFEEAKIDAITWSLADKVEGVQVSTLGVVTVTENAKAGTITLKATAEVHGSKIALEKQVELESLGAASLEIIGSNLLTIPPEGSHTELYQAAVKDKEGQILASEPVKWHLKQDVRGVTISDKGELTVTSEAEAGSLILMATALSDSDVYGSIHISLENPPPPSESEPQDEVEPPPPEDEKKQSEQGGDEPAGDEPVSDEPCGEEPAGDEPVSDEPCGEEPAGDEQAKEEEGVHFKPEDEVKTEGETSG